MVLIWGRVKHISVGADARCHQGQWQRLAAPVMDNESRRYSCKESVPHGIIIRGDGGSGIPKHPHICEHGEVLATVSVGISGEGGGRWH